MYFTIIWSQFISLSFLPKLSRFIPPVPPVRISKLFLHSRAAEIEGRLLVYLEDDSGFWFPAPADLVDFGVPISSDHFGHPAPSLLEVNTTFTIHLGNMLAKDSPLEGW